ncbi:gram-positive signal peptide%2C YSIRK family [Chlamydia trachomatis]|nr:gram-positive signal peptide%2C YSIRK family [Chlamydia trachomatis]
MKKFKSLIENRKQNKVYRYYIKRLSIGVVSCVVGAFVLFGTTSLMVENNTIYAKEMNKTENSKVQNFDNKKSANFRTFLFFNIFFYCFFNGS